MKHSIILMTALLPTTGHADLIEFSANIPDTKTHVLINGRTFEPVPLEERVESLREHFANDKNVEIVGSMNDDAPQNPDDMTNGFWNWWKNEINTNFPNIEGQWDYVVASEAYGENVAKSLNADFIPYDIDRVLNISRGTNIRNNIHGQWNNVLPEFKKHLHMSFTMFGQESVGKTTLSKLVAERLDATWLMEYARPYLENVGEELSLKKMENIHHGQFALQKMNFNNPRKPITVLDTDLFSTVGYYRIGWNKAPQRLIEDALKVQTDHYYLLPDDIPFVEDPLRYGGNVRESSLNFWKDILEEFNLSYTIVPSGSVEEKTGFIVSDIIDRFNKRIDKITLFKRT